MLGRSISENLIDSNSNSWSKQITIEPVVFLYMLAIYMNIPTDEALLYRQVCFQFYNESSCAAITEHLILPKSIEEKIQRQTSIYLMYFNFVYSIPSIFMTMFCAAWSDKYSYKIPMICANVGCILATIVNLCVSKLRTNLSIELLFLSNIFISFFGSTSTMFSIVYNYITRITTAENRTVRIAILESCLLFGSTIGLIISGPLLNYLNFVNVFLIVISIHLINILYICCCVRELIEIDEKIFSLKSFRLWKDIRQSFRILIKSREGNQRKYLLLALTGLLISVLTSVGESSIVYLYLKKSPLAFSQSLYGIFRGFKSFGLAMGLLIFLPLLRYLFDLTDLTCAMIGTLSKCFCDFLYAIGHSSTTIFFIPIVGMFSSYVVVGVRSYLSKICHQDDEGKIFSILASLEAIDALIGSILFNTLYSHLISTSANIIFIIASILHLFTLPIFRLKNEMAFTPYQLFLAGLMLITGSINTLSTKWADRQTSTFCDGSGANVTYEHPFLQVENEKIGVGMFFGEFLCLLAFKFIWYSTARYRIERMTYQGDASSPLVRCWPIRISKETRLVEGEQNFNPFIFWIPSICDMLSTCLSYVALNYTSASSFQMLRGSVMVFTAILSVLFLRKKLTLVHWLGIVTVVSGLSVVGVSDIVFSKTPEGSHSNTEKIAGDLLILVGMLFTSCQMVYEERFIGKYNIPPLQAVGWEGIFGFSTLGLLLIPFYFIIVPTSNASPDHRLEDVFSAFCQMRGNWIIILATLGNVFSIAFFNFAGISVTKELSATTRMVLDSGRTLIIWIVSLALQWQSFYPLQILGFALLVIGMGIYNGVWVHLFRRLVSRRPISAERSQLLPANVDENPDYQATSTQTPADSVNA